MRRRLGRKRQAGANDSLLAERIARWMLAFQRKVADELNTRARRMKQRTLIALLMGIGLVFGAYCLWLSLGLFR